MVLSTRYQVPLLLPYLRYQVVPGNSLVMVDKKCTNIQALSSDVPDDRWIIYRRWPLANFLCYQYQEVVPGTMVLFKVQTSLHGAHENSMYKHFHNHQSQIENYTKTNQNRNETNNKDQLTPDGPLDGPLHAVVCQCPTWRDQKPWINASAFYYCSQVFYG